MKTALKIHLILLLACTLPMALLAQTTVSMPVNVAGATYNISINSGIGQITITSPTGAAYTYSLDGGTYQSSPVFGSLVLGTTHTVSVKTTANGTLSTTPNITIPVCNNDISVGTGAIASMQYDNTGSGTAGYTWCAREVTGPDGLQWLDRNLGAYQVATSTTDALSYGSLYEWGRKSDGHQIAGGTRGVDATTASPTTTTQAATDVPGNNMFVIGATDWRSDQNSNRWSLVSGSGATLTQANNPCPFGYHVPTKAQQVTLASGWANPASAYGTTLKMPIMQGYRDNSDGLLYLIGASGFYWSSTTYSIPTYANAIVLAADYNSFNNNPFYKSYGYSVRCIKN